jgi:hypothetical protein
MPKETEHVYSGSLNYDEKGNYYGVYTPSAVGYTPSGQTYYHTSDGQIQYNSHGGRSRRGHKRSSCPYSKKGGWRSCEKEIMRSDCEGRAECKWERNGCELDEGYVIGLGAGIANFNRGGKSRKRGRRGHKKSSRKSRSRR